MTALADGRFIGCMRALRIPPLFLIPALLIVALLAQAPEVDADPVGETLFLDVDGIPGESTRLGFENTIEIESFEWGVNSGNPPRFSTMTVRKHVDRASPRLMLRAAKGSVIPGAALHVIPVGGTHTDEYLTYCLTQVRVKSVKTVGDGASNQGLHEAVELSYRTIVETYRQQSAGGGLLPPVVGGWDTGEDKEFSSDC